MLRTEDAERLARAFALDGEAHLEGPVDRGEQGQVWRLDVQGERYAVEETFAPLADEQVRLVYAFQRQAVAAGVRVLPLGRRAGAGQVDQRPDHAGGRRRARG